MNKKTVVCGIFVLLWWVSLGGVVSADVVISEIMYDLEGSDADREWIEVWNNGATSVDLKNYIFKDFPTSSNHALTAVLGGTSVSAGGFAVIASDANKFQTDQTAFSGVLFSANFSLNNIGATISIKPTKDLPASSEVAYVSSQGASGNGRSLQLVSGVWVEGLPTPGAVNAEGAPVDPPPTDTITTATPTGAVTATSVVPAKKEFVPPPRITAEIVAKGQVLAGIPAVFESRVLGYSKELITSGRAYWNFGDGASVETMNATMPYSGGKLEHIYKYPGEYVVIFNYFSDYYASEPTVSERFIVRAVPADIRISSIGSVVDPYVELYNPTTYELDISKWVIRGARSDFVIPQHTYVLPGKKVVLSVEDTGFSADDLETLTLVYPTGRQGFEYDTRTNDAVSSLATQQSSQNRTPLTTRGLTVTEIRSVAGSSTKSEAPVPLQAGVFGAVDESKPEENKNPPADKGRGWPYWPVVGLIGVVGLASGISFAIRKKNTEALGISADDVRIIE